MASNNTFRLEGPLIQNLNNFDEHANKAMIAGANFVAPEIESFMRSNAPWEDRTGNARSGLKAKVAVSKDKVAIILYHSVPYGVYLEVRWGGKYGIIPDAMAAGGPRLVEVVGRLML